MNLRHALADALHMLWGSYVDHNGPTCHACLEDVDEALLPVATLFAAEQLRAAADDAEDVGWWPHADRLRNRAAILQNGADLTESLGQMRRREGAVLAPRPSEPPA
jgi:hypothetical protein